MNPSPTDYDYPLAVGTPVVGDLPHSDQPLPTPAATLTAAPASALSPSAAGSLDFAFGSDGRVLSYNAGGAVALAIQADGKIVTVGSVPRIYASPSAFVLHRFNPDGSLDCPFGSNGTLGTNPFGDAHDVGAYAVALQTDGKILLVGTVMPKCSISLYCVILRTAHSILPLARVAK